MKEEGFIDAKVTSDERRELTKGIKREKIPGPSPLKPSC